MRLASCLLGSQPVYGVVEDDGIAIISTVLGERYPSLRSLLAGAADGQLYRKIDHAVASSPTVALSEVTFLPVIPEPQKIICVGLNYTPHREETGRAPVDYPTLFTRFANSQVGHEAAIIAPSASRHFDYEGELAVIIGKQGRHIDQRDAEDYIAGYTCFNDGSVRDYQRHSSQFTPGKNFHASGACGPWMVTADSVGDIRAATLVTRLNGKVLQSAVIADMDFSIPQLIHYISGFTQLEPGDLIVTGTPGGVGYVRKPPIYMCHGDCVEVEISAIGVLRNPIVDEAS
ncbi:MAG: fumarylacetoacetate hydrolase family protein [Pseudomonadota bacterium]